MLIFRFVGRFFGALPCIYYARPWQKTGSSFTHTFRQIDQLLGFVVLRFEIDSILRTHVTDNVEINILMTIIF